MTDEAKLQRLWNEHQDADNVFELLAEAFLERSLQSIKTRLTRLGVPWKRSRSTRTVWTEEVTVCNLAVCSLSQQEDEILKRAYERHMVVSLVGASTYRVAGCL